MLARLFFGASSIEDPIYRAASPLFFVTPATAPMLLIAGRRDTIAPYEQAEAFAAALRASGVPVTLAPFDGGHTGEGLDRAGRERNQALAVNFVRSMLHPEPVAR